MSTDKSMIATGDNEVKLDEFRRGVTSPGIPGLQDAYTLSTEAIDRASAPAGSGNQHQGLDEQLDASGKYVRSQLDARNARHFENATREAARFCKKHVEALDALMESPDMKRAAEIVPQALKALRDGYETFRQKHGNTTAAIFAPDFIPHSKEYNAAFKAEILKPDDTTGATKEKGAEGSYYEQDKVGHASTFTVIGRLSDEETKQLFTTLAAAGKDRLAPTKDASKDTRDITPAESNSLKTMVGYRVGELNGGSDLLKASAALFANAPSSAAVREVVSEKDMALIAEASQLMNNAVIPGLTSLPGNSKDQLLEGTKIMTHSPEDRAAQVLRRGFVSPKGAPSWDTGRKKFVDEQVARRNGSNGSPSI